MVQSVNDKNRQQDKNDDQIVVHDGRKGDAKQCWYGNAGNSHRASGHGNPVENNNPRNLTKPQGRECQENRPQS